MISDTARQVIEDIAINLAITQWLVTLPYLGVFLNLPGVRQAVVIIAEWILDPLFKNMQMFVNFTEIDLKDSALKAQADQAKTILRGVLDDPNADQSQVKMAVDNFKRQYGAIIRMSTHTP